MKSLNKISLIGNLGGDPEIKYLPSGDAVVEFSLATSDSWKDKQTGEMQERTEWHRIKFFKRAAETIGSYMKKGSRMFVEGRIQSREYMKDGQTRRVVEVLGHEFMFLDNRGTETQSPGAEQNATPPPAAPANHTTNSL